MNVIRPDCEGSNKAHTSLNAPKRPRGTDPADQAAEAKSAEAHREAARDGALRDGDEELARTARLTSLLHRAGVGSENTIALRNAGSTQAQAVSGDAVVKAPTKIEELQLGPVQAPRIELNQRLSESALSFAQNVDRAVGNHLVQTAAALSSQHIQLDRTNTRLNLVERGDGSGAHGDTQRQPLTPEQARAEANQNVLARIVPQRAAQIDNADEQQRGLAHLVEAPAVDHTADHAVDHTNDAEDPNLQLDQGVVQNNGMPTQHGILTAPTHTTVTAGDNKAKVKGDTRLVTDANAGLQQQKKGSGNIANAEQLGKRLSLLDMSNLSSDQMLAEFLKLNINDPNANVETQNKLYTLASEMRKQAIEEAKKRIERAQELMKEAQKYADQVQKYADMAGMIGIFAAFLGPLGAIISGIMQIAVAVAQYEAQMKILDAKEEKNNAERFKLMGDMHQDQVHETGEVINTIMELKNQMIESVIQMLNASFSTRQQLMSAAMAR